MVTNLNVPAVCQLMNEPLGECLEIGEYWMVVYHPPLLQKLIYLYTVQVVSSPFSTFHQTISVIFVDIVILEQSTKNFNLYNLNRQFDYQIFKYC